MRHKYLLIIFGALVLQGCSPKAPEVKKVESSAVQEEEAYFEPVNEPIPESVSTQTAIVPQEEQEEAEVSEISELQEQEDISQVLIDEEIIIQAEEESRWPKNRGKTYNELQFSDDLDDYPFTPSTDDGNYYDRTFDNADR